MSVCIQHKNRDNFSQSMNACKTTSSYSLTKAYEYIGIWSSRSRQRKDLAKLSDELLDDIGYTREEARKEINKPFWE